MSSIVVFDQRKYFEISVKYVSQIDDQANMQTMKIIFQIIEELEKKYNQIFKETLKQQSTNYSK